MDSAPPVLRFEHISKTFGTGQALSDITVNFSAGQVTASAAATVPASRC